METLAKQISQTKTGIVFSLLGTSLPCLGLIKQIIEPTGDKNVILIVGALAVIFFAIALSLFVALSKIKQPEQRLFWSKYLRNVGFLFIFYPFVGFLASIFLIKAGNIGLAEIKNHQ